MSVEQEEEDEQGFLDEEDFEDDVENGARGRGRGREERVSSAADIFGEAESSAEELDEASDAVDGDGDGGSDVSGLQDGEFGGLYNPRDVNDQYFEELCIGEEVAEEMSRAWTGFLSSADSREAAGEAIYAAIYDAAPGLQGLFKTPRAVMSLRLMIGLSQIVSGLNDPKALKVLVETLGFQHMDFEVTIPRVVLIRDALLDLFSVEMGSQFTQRASEGWATTLNYVGGAFIFIRVKYADRFKVLASSWAQANNRDVDPDDAAVDEDEASTTTGGAPGSGSSDASVSTPGASGIGSVATSPGQSQETGLTEIHEESRRKKHKVGTGGILGSRKKGDGDKSDRARGASDQGKGRHQFRNTAVPRTFQDMFMFNTAVMGYGSAAWMQEILHSFDTIVTNISNSHRLQEECDVLSLRLAKYRGPMDLSEYRAVMLASLRSLVKDWGCVHETSWLWLWESVERMLTSLVGKPVTQAAALAEMLSSLDGSHLMLLRREVYKNFFAMTPGGQDYFKQSTTRLHFIVDRVLAFSLDMYRFPRRMVDDLSALGLRHVGYAIPTDMFPPFVTCCVQVMRLLTGNERGSDAFAWSLNLISRMLQRVITEGSTIVMQAINVNSGKQLKRAVNCAPRGKRASWVLNVQVGTQSISPLMWAIETGSFDAAKAIICDLLTIRADRDRYYYGMDSLFERHPDIIKRLCTDAPAMLPVLLDGLIWRSRFTDGGERRVNYYVKHLIVNSKGAFSPATEWIVDFNDPTIACHSVVALVTDRLWTNLAMRTFLYRRMWFLFTLVVFLLSQSILYHLDGEPVPSHDGTSVGAAADAEAASHRRRLPQDAEGTFDHSFHTRVLVLISRAFIYSCVTGQWLYHHAKCTTHNIRHSLYLRVWRRLKVPAYLASWQDAMNLVLTMLLLAMGFLDPLWHCMEVRAELWDDRCPSADHLRATYATLSTISTLLFYVLLVDLAVFSTRVSAFVLIIGRVVPEVFLFLLGLTFFVLAFASAISSLEHDDPEFSGIPLSTLNLFRISLGMFDGEQFDHMTAYPSLFVAISAFAIVTVIFLLNLLVAQLNCAYAATYQDMFGFARLNRGKLVSETMSLVPKARWDRFVASLHLDQRIEFGEGDLGLAGGVQAFEPAGAHITTVDSIRRFGGATSPNAPWPKDEMVGDDEVDRFDRLERFIEKSMKKLIMGGRRGGAFSAGGSTRGATSALNSSSDKDRSSGGLDHDSD